MTEFVVPILCILSIVGIAVFFKINGAIVFLLVAVGIVAQSEIGGDAVSIATSGLSANTTVAESAVRVGLVLLPLLLAGFLLRRTLSMHKIALHILPLLSAGTVFLLFVPRLLSGSLADEVSASSVYTAIDKFRVAVYVIGILSSLVLLMLELPKHHGDGEHGKH